MYMCEGHMCLMEGPLTFEWSIYIHSTQCFCLEYLDRIKLIQPNDQFYFFNPQNHCAIDWNHLIGQLLWFHLEGHHTHFLWNWVWYFHHLKNSFSDLQLLLGIVGANLVKVISSQDIMALWYLKCKHTREMQKHFWKILK